MKITLSVNEVRRMYNLGHFLASELSPEKYNGVFDKAAVDPVQYLRDNPREGFYLVTLDGVDEPIGIEIEMPEEDLFKILDLYKRHTMLIGGVVTALVGVAKTLKVIMAGMVEDFENLGKTMNFGKTPKK